MNDKCKCLKELSRIEMKLMERFEINEKLMEMRRI